MFWRLAVDVAIAVFLAVLLVGFLAPLVAVFLGTLDLPDGPY